ncbi:uncharacterized protein LOC132752655 [Ruditapes philippinarum]|uniref:uncharacterized protein LOC132752655 n=1 Tax=Ruditapes philippinarum TaxID=129788 RepID=UPI00295B4BB9|nr:uncharacterized protein LOC132752655 [Ruditapes philippinarum]
MDIACVWIFVCMLCYKIFPVIAGLNTELVIFRVNRKHKDTRRCAMESLHHTFGRKDDLTGDCKKLTQAINQTQTVGAGHIEQVYIKKDFNTVMNVGGNKNSGVERTHIELQTPLMPGSRLDFHCSRKPAKI